MDWEEIGLLGGLSEGSKNEITPLLDYGLELLQNRGETSILVDDEATTILMTLSLPAIRRVYVEHGVFDVEHMVNTLATYWNSDRTRGMLQDLNARKGIDGEAELLANFCNNYTPQKNMLPKKTMKKFSINKDG